MDAYPFLYGHHPHYWLREEIKRFQGYLNSPPVSKFLTLSTLGVGVLALYASVGVRSITLERSPFWERFEIWRLYTSFFLGRRRWIFINTWEAYIINDVSKKLEEQHFSRRSSDLAWQTFWACVAIVIITIPINATLYFRSLLGCYIYLYSVLSPNVPFSFLGLATFPMKYYPYTNLLIDLIMDPTRHEVSLTVSGMIVGYIWWRLVWGNELRSRGLVRYASAPRWIRDYFRER